jgi:hypothetical protein
MSYAPNDRFEAWKEKAEAVGLLAAAQMFGAKLKKHGTEFVGPCPFCSGKDRFAINLQKGKWHCRGHGGGASVIAMAMHIGNLAFKEAIERLTGEPPPNGQSKPLSEAEKAERNRRRLAADEAQRQRQAQEDAYQDDTREAALAIWNASTAIRSTVAEAYLNVRGIPMPDEGWPGALRFHPALPYPGKGKFPVLVCRVDDVAGDLTAVWRIYLRADGRKADVPDAKLGLGPAGGGAVRLFGAGKTIAIAEGVETALGYWMLTCGRVPCWAALSTSGLIGFEAPLGIERVLIVPDGDRPIRKKGNEFEPAIPAGRKAAQALRDRLISEGVKASIAAEPPPSRDYLDLWNAHAREVA